MSWYEDLDAAHDYFEEAVQQSLKSIPDEVAKAYLGTYGDAIEKRIQSCLAEAHQLLAEGHPGSALTLTATASELIIRFLLLRPLVQGAFLSEEWAAILARRVAKGRSADDRELLPAILRRWGIDVTAIRTEAGVSVWPFILSTLWPARDHYVHRFDPVSREIVMSALECIAVFQKDVVQVLAKKLGFTLENTGCWAEIRGVEKTDLGERSWAGSFDAADPFKT